MYILKLIVQKILAAEAKLVIRRFGPRVVAVTGSVGKTSTKEAIAAVLSHKFHIRKSPKSYNSELGVPLTILGLESQWYSIFGWTRNIFKGARVLFSSEYPKVLVLEAGVDRPGDMDVFLRLIRPHIGVVTAIGDIPVHVEFFAGPKEVAYEKGKLIRCMDPGGYAVLNADDDTVFDLRAEARGKLISFGFGKGSHIQMSGYRILTSYESGREIPSGVTCEISYQHSKEKIILQGVLGKQQLYIIGAAAAVGIAYDMSLSEIAQALGEYTSSPGRLRLIEGLKGSLILDDTYNASPMAMHAALDTLKDIPAVRRIAVLGDMLEIGKFAIQAHEAMGELASSIVNKLIVVGPRAKFIAKEARAQGMVREDVLEFSTSESAGKYLETILEPGDIVLIKGSQSMRMERAVKEIMAHPEDAKGLLVRQEKHWQST